MQTFIMASFARFFRRSFLFCSFWILVSGVKLLWQTNEISNGITLSYQELLDTLQSCKDSIFQLDNATIVYDIDRDNRFTRLNDSVSEDTTFIFPEVVLKEVNFEDPELNQFGFYKVKFLKDVNIIPSESSGLPGFRQCVFNQKFELYAHLIDQDKSPKNYVFVDQSHFYGPVTLTTSSEFMEVEDCIFYPAYRSSSDSRIDWIFYMVNKDGRVMLDENHFHKGDKKDRIAFIFQEIYTIQVFDNIFGSNVLLPENTIKDVTLRDNIFQRYVDLTNLEFGNAKSEIEFKDISKRVCVYSNADSIWYGHSIEVFSDTIASERFFAVYRKLTDYYKFRGNRKSYNASYTEMKDFETLSLQYDYQQAPSLSNWFSWRMNQFLGKFSNYGTRPVKAILYAIRIILYFAILYFFFHNDWDTFTQDKLITHITLVSTYFQSDEEIATLHRQSTEPKYKSYEEFHSFMQASKKEVPVIFFWISRPLYWLSTIRYTITHGFLQKFELLNGKWSDLGKKQRRRSAWFVSLWLVGYVLIAICIKALNALTLSINSFTTLGFGKIPIHGIPRYAAIIEGFLGWFLLTIFSVSLISQLLQ